MSLAVGWAGGDARGSIWTGAANFVGEDDEKSSSSAVVDERCLVVVAWSASSASPSSVATTTRTVSLRALSPDRARSLSFRRLDGMAFPTRVSSACLPPGGARRSFSTSVDHRPRGWRRARLPGSTRAPSPPARLFRRRRVGGSRRRRRVASPRRLLPRSRRPRRRLRPSPSGGGARRGGQPRRGGVVDPRVRRRPRHGLRRRGDPPSFARRRRPRKPLVPAPAPVPAPAREPLRVRPPRPIARGASSWAAARVAWTPSTANTDPPSCRGCARDSGSTATSRAVD